MKERNLDLMPRQEETRDKIISSTYIVKFQLNEI